MKSIFSTFIFQPLFNLLIGIYLFFPDLGIAIIILTILVRFALLPLSRKSIESQEKLQVLQPEIKKIQKKYKGNRELQGQKMMELYKKKKVNPAGSCLPLIIQLILLIALYRVFMSGVNDTETALLLYSFIPNPGELNHMMLGVIDLAQPHIPLAIIAAILQFIQTKMMLRKVTAKEKSKEKSAEPDFNEILQKQMVIMGPLLTLFIGFKFPSGLVLYWLTSTLFMIIQQYFILKKTQPDKNFIQMLKGEAIDGK
ncbi:MAG TPA: YidC/Oxa1 family membrane protein insertase [Candidatus Moranbacteria bacterium]|nr:YidC/Oxa1 family membrane protein insertase [Candidatus Moranbacteria bacterium]